MKQTQLSPQELDQLSQEESIGLKEMRQAFPAKVFQHSKTRAWFGFIRGIGACILIPYLISLIAFQPNFHMVWQIPLLLFLWVCMGSALVGLIILAHDCGHYAFSKTPWVNHWVGHICTSFTMVGFHNWQISHNQHHAYSQMRKMDTDWPEKMMTAEEFKAAKGLEKLFTMIGYGSALGLLVGFFAGNFRRTFLALGYPQIHLNPRKKRQLLFSTVVMILCSGSLQVGLFYFTGPLGLIKYYWGGAFFGFTLGSLITQVQHTNANTLVFDKEGWSAFRGHVVCTFNVRFPRIIEFLAFDFNYHIAHHISPQIPWYHLRTATKALKETYPQYIQERPLSWKDLNEFWNHPILKQAEHGVYTMQGIPK